MKNVLYSAFKMLMENYEQIFRKNYAKSNLEELLLNLRERGITQMEMTLLLCKELKMSLSDATNQVSNSKTWEDRKEINEAFTRQLGDTLDSL